MTSSDTTTATLENGLPNINRYITTTTKADGLAVFSTALPVPSIWQTLTTISTNTKFLLDYTTRTFPINLLCSLSPSSPTPDISAYQADIANPPGIPVSDGTVMRYGDMAPGTESPMHCTRSLDYGIVIEGEVELRLDSGEKRILRRGDSCVQRGTFHAWRNVSQGGKWARIVFVVVGAEGEGLEKEFAVKEYIEKNE